MCFTDDGDYDWYPQDVAETDGPAPKATRCDECRQRIHAGEWRRLVVASQYEVGYCPRCEDDGDDNESCAEDGHVVGEESEYRSCRRCQDLREAIRKVEEGEGCEGREAEPLFGELFEAVEGGEGWEHYTDAMLRLGLTAVVAAMEAPDADEVFETLAYGRSRYPGTRGEYPGAWCRSLDDPHHDPDTGGEG